jgi:16S rRNA (guanine527-N7)-methyltransferase
MAEIHKNDSPESFAQLIDVSRETLDKLIVYVELLNKWQRRINLVGPKTLPEVWRRHFLDSAQVYTYIDNSTGPLLDLGSGAGFPGLVLSIMGIPNITLVESNQKKCSFLGEVIRQADCDAQVFKGRIKDYPHKKLAETITARALAPLEDLLTWSYPLLSEGGKCLFLKGETHEQELTAAKKRWTMDVQIHPSKADNTNSRDESATGALLEIGKLTPRDG